MNNVKTTRNDEKYIIFREQLRKRDREGRSRISSLFLAQVQIFLKLLHIIHRRCGSALSDTGSGLGCLLISNISTSTHCQTRAVQDVIMLEYLLFSASALVKTFMVLSCQVANQQHQSQCTPHYQHTRIARRHNRHNCTLSYAGSDDLQYSG